ncbi:uncharacterized protein LOC121738824 isoform X1 [Aricia agestis]|uniref:uncharacterized protein LOC121738824 isoform X1 n=1 Tax=Aricia agestis TaxID=91739 RepID=UPI001C20A4DF|nr:uncharacterized protein LOC121738824 isoform X1 [Aricia agestis]
MTVRARPLTHLVVNKMELKSRLAWDNKLEMEFLKHYFTENILWNQKNPYYRDRHQNYLAWDRISNAMNMDIEELKKKKDSLLSSYRLYRNKVKKSLINGSGAVYQPIWFAFSYMDSFLSKGQTEVKQLDVGDEDSDDPLCQETEEDDKGNIYLIPIKNEQLKTPSAKRQRRSLPTQKFEESSTIDMHEISQAYTINNPHEEDDCDRYVKILANKLRKLPEDERIIIMHEIDGLFVKRIQNKFNSSEA